MPGVDGSSRAALLLDGLPSGRAGLTSLVPRQPRPRPIPAFDWFPDAWQRTANRESSMSPRILGAAASAAILALGLVAAYRADLDTTPDRIATAAAAPKRSTDSSPAALDGAAASAPPLRHPLQAHLMSLAGPSRDSVLLAIVRDAGFTCGEILGSTALGDGLAAWRVSCPGAEAYVVSVDTLGEQRVDSLYLWEGIRPRVIRVEGSDPSLVPDLRR